MWKTAVLLLLCGVSSCLGRHYNTSGGPVPGKINVHLVCHTHDDVGWLKTVDQYFYAANQSIQDAGVRYIISTMVAELYNNPDRKFTYIEQAFFVRWWREQDDIMKQRVKDLVSRGQLAFENGGWCMHDEAAPHYIDMIDQTTIGHRFLREEFGSIPKVGWQIDPFGHSATQASYLSAAMGFDSLFFARIDYQDKAQRDKDHALEMIWRASPSLPQYQVFTGEFYIGYGPPDGFNWNSIDAPIRDDPRLHDYDVTTVIEQFIQQAQEWDQHVLGGHQMWLLGSDFEYSNAFSWFENLDKLIHWVNLDGRVNVFYSNPYIYTQEKLKAAVQWPLKENDDFFPYADCPHCFWTGYFTSRPAFKRYVRTTSSWYTAARQAVTLAGTSVEGLERLSEAMHHDGVSGTEKQHTAFDYAQRLAEGVAIAESSFSEALRTLTGSPMGFTFCHRMNVSECESTASIGKGAADVTMVIWNSLAQNRPHHAVIPVGGNQVGVYDAAGKPIPSQVISSMHSVTNYGPNPSGLPYTVVFEAQLPALGYNTYVLGKPNALSSIVGSKLSANTTLENANVRVVFGADGRIAEITNKVSGLRLPVTQDFGYYQSSHDQGQNSGAYVFRPNSSSVFPVGSGPVSLTVIGKPGDLVQEVRQVFSPWVQQTVRLFNTSHHVEVEYTVGEVPIDDQWGKEVISKFTTPIKSNGYFYQDSNGREYMERKRDWRKYWKLDQTEPVAGNYYPTTTGGYVRDTSAQLTVLTDASVGAGSIQDGSMEFMVHRRVLHDDSRGVGEAINETEWVDPYCCGFNGGTKHGPGLIIRGRMVLVVDAPATSASQWRVSQDHLYAGGHVAFTTAPANSLPTPSSSGLKAPLPDNLQIMTLERLPGSVWNTHNVLLRVSHQFGVGEDEKLSGPVFVNLADLFSRVIPFPLLPSVQLVPWLQFNVADAMETTLSANQPKSAVKQPRVQVQGEPAGKWEKQAAANVGAPLDAMSFTITHLDVRTFLITV